MRALHVFAGIGGSVLAGRMLGWESVGCVELDPFCCAVLEHHGEKILANDICDFKAIWFSGCVDIVVGGSPCQDLSVAGRRAGLDGEKSSLWFQQLRVAQECKAAFIWWENVHGALSSNSGRDFLTILTSLAQAGYDAKWTVNRASDVGAPHRRARVWLLARLRALGHAPSRGLARGDAERQPVFNAGETGEFSNADQSQRQTGIPRGIEPQNSQPYSTGPFESRLGRNTYGFPAGMDQPQHAWEPSRTVEGKIPHRNARLKALGNAWVPQQAVAAWYELTAV